MDNKDAIDFLKRSMKKDADYAFVWYSNICMMIKDEGVKNKKAEKAADNIMRLCFNIDMDEVRKALE